MSTDEEGDIRINVEEVAAMLTEKLNTHQHMLPECCIFQTPESLSRHNKNAYIPKAFGIGPLHYRKQVFVGTEKIKLKYLDGILNRSPQKKMQELIKAVAQFEGYAYKCYARPVGLNPTIFVEMLVVDGCFIIELFRKDNDRRLRESDDPIFTMANTLQTVHHDLILLENQIPWIVLEKLFDLTKIGDEHQASLDHLTLEFFGNIFTSEVPKANEHQWSKIRSKGIKHILDLLRSFLIYSYEEDPNQTSYGWMPLPSATTLNHLGFKFKPLSGTSILDVQFNNGCLEIPSILLQETTETIFRNLVLLEQCLPNYQPRITSYVKLMENLIDTEEDIKVLHNNRIVHNWVNLNEATKIFNQPYTDAYLKEFNYRMLCKRVDAFRIKQIAKIIPEARYKLIHNYCSDPWVTCGTIVVIIIFLLTILQTVYG